MFKYGRVILACCLGLSLGGTLSAANAQNVRSFFLFPGNTLTPDKAYFAPGNKYFLVFQSSDGNLVVYKVGQTSNTPIWSANSFGGDTAVLQSDGNFVIYRTKGVAQPVPVFNTGAGKPGGTTGPSGSLYDNGSFSVLNTSNVEFKTPGDPSYVPAPDPSCPTARQYPVCTFPGTINQFNGWVLACSVSDAQRQAAATGSSFGRCPGT